MKKITVLFLLISYSSFSTIIYRDIVDYQMTIPFTSSFDFDFNNDGTIEFNMQCVPNPRGGAGMYFGDFSTTTGFITWSSSTSVPGSGWDIARPLSLNASINAASVWGPTDFSFNLAFGTIPQEFPIGDSYTGCFVTMNGQKYYAWILLNYNGSFFTIKSFAYENISNTGIMAGQVNLSIQDFSESGIAYFYNNVTKTLIFEKNELLDSVSTFEISGRKIQAELINNQIDFSSFQSGIYILNLTLKNNKKYSIKTFIY
jgi:hypothetical protein